MGLYSLSYSNEYSCLALVSVSLLVSELLHTSAINTKFQVEALLPIAADGAIGAIQVVTSQFATFALLRVHSHSVTIFVSLAFIGQYWAVGGVGWEICAVLACCLFRPLVVR
jgi:hypothetical protein